MMYQSSKGAVEVSTMPLSHAKNALNKLSRGEPERIAEIEALTAHVSALEAQAVDKNLAPQPREAVIGDNGGPAIVEATPKPDSREAVNIHVADLLEQAAQWADGVAIETEGQANSVGLLHRMLQEAAALVNDTAATEKKPLNKALAEIATWQNGFTAKGLKQTPDGSLTKALQATGNLSTAWLRKQDDERKAREKEAAEKALAAAQAAVVKREEAKTSGDLNVIDSAEDALAQAAALLRTANCVAKERVQAGGGEGVRALGLRSSWSAHPTGEPGAWAAAYNHYKSNPEFMADFHALIQRWADRDVRAEATRVRGVPGFNFIEQKVAA